MADLIYQLIVIYVLIGAVWGWWLSRDDNFVHEMNARRNRESAPEPFNKRDIAFGMGIVWPYSMILWALSK
jgi:hypothetical protein